MFFVPCIYDVKISIAINPVFDNMGVVYLYLSMINFATAGLDKGSNHTLCGTFYSVA